MVNLLNRRKWIIGPLIGAGFALIAWIAPSMAATLKDIRVGQYDSYTRIVLEFDDPFELQEIKSHTPGHLTIQFSDALPGLVRKIPVERSRKLKDIQIWQRENGLSIILVLSFDRFRHESFQLPTPPRIALDIFPVAAVETPAAETSTVTQPLNSDRTIAKPPDTKTQTLSTPDDQIPYPAKRQQARAEKQPAEELPMDETDIKPSVQEPTGKALKTSKPRPTVIKRQDISPSPTDESSNRQGTLQFQFYLVLTLVIITIVILVLLLLMLLFRQRWAGEQGKISTGESLKRQDERIAMLNARIREQLKRYDEV